MDDDPLVRESIEAMLSQDAHDLELVDSGSDALRLYQPGRFDVVLTDNRMPGMSGLELAAEIKARSPSQAVILFTGAPTSGPASACDLILLKPFSGAQLRTAVARFPAGS